MEFLGVYFDDPREVPEDELRSMAAMRVRDDLELPQGLTQARLAAGRHARVRVRGPYSGLPAAWQWVHREWLPGTAERDRGAPSFETYVNDPGSVPESDLLTLIYLPLA